MEGERAENFLGCKKKSKSIKWKEMEIRKRCDK